MRRIGTVALLAILLAALLAAPSSAQVQSSPAPAVAQQSMVYGAPQAQAPAQTQVGGPQRSRGWFKRWWKRAKCAAAITVVLASTVFVVSKIVKIRRAIRALGGIKKAAKALAGKSRGEKMEKLAKAGGAAAAYFLGIDTIKEAC